MGIRVPWEIRGLYLDSCNCDWGCPCQFNARPTHGNCEGLGVVHIQQGRFDSVRLGGLNFAAAYAFPNAVHEGHGRAAYYIDRRSTASQFTGLADILTGEAGGGPFEIYARLTDTHHSPRRAAITFENRGIRSRANVGGMASLALGPILNPVTGKVHRAVIELPGGFEASRMDQASTMKLRVGDGDLSFRYEGTYASFAKVRWSGP